MPWQRPHWNVRVETFRRVEWNLPRAVRSALALSLVRSGSSAILSGYLGKNDAFWEGMANLSVAYVSRIKTTTQSSNGQFVRSQKKAVC